MLTLILTGLLRGVRTHRALVLENLALRHQLGVLQRTAPRPRLRASDRVFWVLLARLWHGWVEVVAIVQPETVIRWQRAGFRLVWTWKSRQQGAAARQSPRRSVRSSAGWLRPTPWGGRRGFTANSGSWVSRSHRRNQPDSLPGNRLTLAEKASMRAALGKRRQPDRCVGALG